MRKIKTMKEIESDKLRSLQLQVNVLKLRNALMKKMITKESFKNFCSDHESKFQNKEEAYRYAEKIHKELFGRTKYEGYHEFISSINSINRCYERIN